MLAKLTIRQTIESGLPALILVILLILNYVFFFEVPYLGFDLNHSEGKVIKIWGKQPASQSLQANDQILQLGLLDWATISGDNRQSLLGNLETGDDVEIRIQRGNQERTIVWRITGPTPEELIGRMIVIWLWFIFWLAGTATIFLVRPRSVRWRLLIAIFYLMAALLMFGWMSNYGVWYSRILLRAIAWLILPVFLHLSWVFPRPLGVIPLGLLWAGYLCAGILAGLEFFQLLPQQAYVIGILLALGGNISLLILHAILQPDVRRDIKVLAAAIILAAFSGFLLGFQVITHTALQLWFLLVALLSISALPGAYFYVIYRHQLGALEVRANRVISFYMFSVLLFTISIFAVWIVNFKIDNRVSEVASEVAVLFLIGLMAATIYPSFQQLIERRLLGIRLPPTQLVEAYTAKIATSLDRESLVTLLRDEILPSLLARQSALLSIRDGNPIKLLYVFGIEESETPNKADIPALMKQSRKYQPPDLDNDFEDHLKWVRLVIPLEVGGELTGMWLLGRRDPDDYYNQSEITSLQIIANQTAIALINIAHMELLHTLYQADIEREENERAALARGLHDEVLNQLAIFFMRQPANVEGASFEESELMITNYLRKVISDLRPAMLNYGLRPAIDELVDNLSQRVTKSPEMAVDMSPISVRFDPIIEQHIFRIVQQACENSLRHSQARMIRIRGNLTSERIHLIVEDDGRGFQMAGTLDLDELLRLEHYGLVGMYERASIIGADLNIRSQQSQGTCVEVIWPKNGQA